MGAFNKILLLGNCTKDIEVKYSSSGNAYAQWGMAVNRKWTSKDGEKQEEVLFVDVKAFGRTAEIAGEYLQKGSPVFIEGRLTLYQWEDEETKQQRSKHSVMVESLQLLPRSGNGQRRQGPPAGDEAQVAAKMPEGGEVADPADIVPF